MAVRIIVPIIVVLAVAALLWTWYRQSLARLEPDDSTPIRPVRLTAEALRRLPSPPWRVVHEIADGTLGSIDHVVIGPGGAIAIETSVGERDGDRADPPDPATPHELAAASVARGEVDDLLAWTGASCILLARVVWGPPRADTPPAAEIMTGVVEIDGHRIEEWFVSLPPGRLSPSQVDLAWAAVVTGIGRPDPIP